jgi:hypothetical protein
MQEYSAQRFQVPPGLPELLKRWTKEVLRYQPDSIEDFSQKYFTALAEGTAAQFFETMEPANITFRRSEVEMEATDKPLEADVGDVGNDAEGAATKIQALHEKKTGKANLKEATVATAEEPVDIEDNEDTQKAAVKIQSVQRGRQARKEVQEKRAAASDKPSEDAAEVQVDAVAEAIEESEEARTEAVTVEGEAAATEEKPADASAAEAAAAEGETAAAEGEAPAES